MPYVAEELHSRWHERVVFGELEFGREDAAFVRSAFGSLDQGFPDEEVVFVHWTGCDAIGRVRSEVFILLEESLRGYRVHCAVIKSLAQLLNDAGTESARKWVR